MVNRVELSTFLGEQARPVGRVCLVEDGASTFSRFEYTPSWLEDPKAFAISPELALLAGPHFRKPATPGDPNIFLSLADTTPGSWGRKIIDKARSRSADAAVSPAPATALDYLLSVNDTCRLGALRVQRQVTGTGTRPRTSKSLALPGLDDLPQALGASWALEKGNPFDADWDFLLRFGTALGGSRPKVCLQDQDGAMALAKLPYLRENLSVPAGEVLSLTLARGGGVDAVQARIVRCRDFPVAVIQRFDRPPGGGRKPYISAATLLQARQYEELGYADLLGAMRRVSRDFPKEARELWRRLVFNLLTTNVDDHLLNLGFLYDGRGHWRLAPAFDLNPFPHSPRVSRTPLSHKAGPITSLDMLLDHAPMFELTTSAALSVVSEVAGAIKDWRQTGRSSAVGASREELGRFEAAFEHDQLEEALRLSSKSHPKRLIR